jgi:NAD(P)-dependent dehydrogenase (short-subunit alcohol dehydrogenase family)
MILKDKVVVVSGIGPGLGQELAYGAAEEGAKVVLAARTESKLKEVEAEIKSQGGEVISVITDITSLESCQNLVEETVSKFGKVDCLLNSAYRPGNFTEFDQGDMEDWKETMNTNYFGTMQLTLEAVKQMKIQKSGSIVMINSLITKKPLQTQGGYAASKGALTASTKILAKELGPHGIRVNAVYMGWMWGPPVEGYVNETAKAMNIDAETIIKGITKDIPLGIIPDDRDCANAALFLASDLAKVITGANLDVNGGEFMS